MNFIPFVWALLGLLLILSEFFVPGVVIVFFGSGALLSALLTALIPPLRSNIVLQIFIWLGTSGLFLVTLRRYFAKIFKGRLANGKSDADFVGKRVKVVEKIKPGQAGRIRYQGTTWKAESYNESFKRGETVEILKKENLTFIVTKSLLEDNSEKVQD
jgi:membrane protein implicated in regulation of membrane protease activity